MDSCWGRLRMEAAATKPRGKGRLRWSPIFAPVSVSRQATAAGLASERPRRPHELRPPPGTGRCRGRVADACRRRSPRPHTPWPAGGVRGRRRRGRSSRQRPARCGGECSPPSASPTNLTLPLGTRSSSASLLARSTSRATLRIRNNAPIPTWSNQLEHMLDGPQTALHEVGLRSHCEQIQ
jgi:hypothetical protein